MSHNTVILKTRRRHVVRLFTLSMLTSFLYTYASAGDLPERIGNKGKYKNNIVGFSDCGKTDTTIAVDPLTGEEKVILSYQAETPVLLNGEKIFSYEDFSEEAISRLGDPATAYGGYTAESLKEYIINNLQDDIRKWQDGMYIISLNHIVISKDGKVAYFELGDITKVIPHDGPLKTEQVPGLKMMQKKIAGIIGNAPAHSPTYYKGEAVNCTMSSRAFSNSFTVKGGKVIAQ